MLDPNPTEVDFSSANFNEYRFRLFWQATSRVYEIFLNCRTTDILVLSY